MSSGQNETPAAAKVLETQESGSENEVSLGLVESEKERGATGDIHKHSETSFKCII